MSDFPLIRGFEDAWRPPVRTNRRRPEELLGQGGSSGEAHLRARLSRIADRAPEVMIKVTGRTHDIGGLRAHLNYISRNGALPLEDRDGAILSERGEARDRAEAWETAEELDGRRRTNTPLSHSIMLSMPAGTDASKLRDAARAFAATLFASERDYLFTLHTDTPRPHVHLAVCSRGDNGERLNPRKADLETWRQVFAQTLRDRGVEAEATPRRARGVTRKAEKGPLRRIRERQNTGGQPARIIRSAYVDAASAAFRPEPTQPIWETRIAERQGQIRALYLAQAQILSRSSDPADQALGVKVEAFVVSMPAPDTQRLALARELRAANAGLTRPDTPPGRERGR